MFLVPSFLSSKKQVRAVAKIQSHDIEGAVVAICNSTHHVQEGPYFYASCLSRNNLTLLPFSEPPTGHHYHTTHYLHFYDNYSKAFSSQRVKENMGDISNLKKVVC